MKKVDFYFSETHHANQMNPLKWFGSRDESMPLVKINEKYMPFSEQIEHGKTPHLKHTDLKLIGTVDKNDVDIKWQSKLSFSTQ